MKTPSATAIAPALLSVLALLSPSLAASQAADNATGIFDDHFRTLRVAVADNPLSPPLITLNGGDRIEVSFDEIAEDRRYMRYSLDHRNADWSASQLVEPEYLDGFNQADVTDYSFSRATTVHYVNYKITLPNDDMRMLVSGNYLLRVWDERDPDTTLLQARFSVMEPGADVTASVTSRTDIDYNKSHQQLEVAVDVDRSTVADPFNDLVLVVAQDGRVDNQVYLTRPSRLSGSRVIYEHNPSLIFPAGNEYRRMEISSTRFPGMRVEGIGYYDPYYNFTLATDEPRSREPYSYDSTQFGRFTVREYDSTESDTEADYAVVHFTLDMEPRAGVDIFLDGDFTQRRFDPESMMVYNRATGLYERSMLLKQGAYNYQYLAVPAGTKRGFTAQVEGDFYETVNEYLIKVYNRPVGSRYDRLIGATLIYSGR